MKRLHVSGQPWYKPELCDDCPSLHQVSATIPGATALVGYCETMEAEEPCPKEVER